MNWRLFVETASLLFRHGNWSVILCALSGAPSIEIRRPSHENWALHVKIVTPRFISANIKVKVT